MKYTLTFLICLMTISANAANPAFGDFNANQFGTTGNKVAVKSGVLLTNPIVDVKLTVGTLVESNTSANISTFYKNGTPVWSTAPGGNNSLVPLNSYVTGNKFIGTNVSGDPDAFLSIEGQYLYFNKIVGGATPTLNHNAGSIRGALSNDPIFLFDAYTNSFGLTGTNGIAINGGLVGTAFTGPITGNGAGLTNYASSNLNANSQIPIGSLFAATTNGNAGGFLLETISGTRYRTYNGALLTNVDVSTAIGEVVPVPAGFTFTNLVTVYRKGAYYWTSLSPSTFDRTRTATRYVLTNGNDANDGLGWATAKASLTNALTNISTSAKVYFGPGLYLGIGTSNVTFGNGKDLSLICTGGLATIGSVTLNEGDVYYSNMWFAAYGAGNPVSITCHGTTNLICMVNCGVSGGTGDGLSIAVNGGLSYLRDCCVISNASDGFNYGKVSGGDTTLCVVEERCSGLWNGSTNSADNNSTAHDGTRVIRLNGSYFRSVGRSVHDVGTGGSWNINCQSGGCRLAGATVDVGFSCASGSDTTFMCLDGCTALMGSPLYQIFGANGILLVNPFQPINDDIINTTRDIRTLGALRAENGLTVSNSAFVAAGTSDVNAGGTGADARVAGGMNIAKRLAVASNILAATITLTNNPTLNTTNAAPAGLIIGTTVPVVWFAVTNGGTKYLFPGYAP